VELIAAGLKVVAENRPLFEHLATEQIRAGAVLSKERGIVIDLDHVAGHRIVEPKNAPRRGR